MVFVTIMHASHNSRKQHIVYAGTSRGKALLKAEEFIRNCPDDTSYGYIQHWAYAECKEIETVKF